MNMYQFQTLKFDGSPSGLTNFGGGKGVKSGMDVFAGVSDALSPYTPDSAPPAANQGATEINNAAAALTNTPAVSATDTMTPDVPNTVSAPYVYTGASGEVQPQNRSMILGQGGYVNANIDSGWTPDFSGFQQRFQDAMSADPYAMQNRPEAQAAFNKYLTQASDPGVYQKMLAQSPGQLTDSMWAYVMGGMHSDPGALAAQSSWETDHPAAAEYERFQSSLRGAQEYGVVNWIHLGPNMPGTDEWGGMFINPNRPSYSSGYNLGIQPSWSTAGADLGLANLRSAADAERQAGNVSENTGGKNYAAP